MRKEYRNEDVEWSELKLGRAGKEMTSRGTNQRETRIRN